MLTLIIKRQHRVHFQEEWQLGQGRFVDQRLGTDPEAMLMLIANGPELEYLHQHMTGVPFANRKQCVWTGDMAAFIVNNLTAD